jgi:flagellar biosynthesis protein FlhA
MDLSRALQTYTVLTIGDGLVTVIPALMISISGGLIVTRASSEDDLGSDIGNQLFGKPKPLMFASGVLVILGMFPGLPNIPFLAIGAGLGFLAWRMQQKLETAAATESEAKPSAVKEDVEGLLRVEPLSIELGLGLVRYVAGGPASPLLKRIASIRSKLASDTGFLLGPVRVIDNMRLKSHEYIVLLKGAEIGRFELVPGCELAIPVNKNEGPVGGRPTKEPAFGMAGWWIPAEQADSAKRKGFTVVDGVSVMGTHLSELTLRYAAELFSRQDAKKFLDRISTDHPKAVEDLVPKVMPLSAVQRVLQNLLKERVSIRDAVTIVEAMGEAAVTIRNPILITEYVRQSLRRIIVRPYLDAKGELHAWMMDPKLEQLVEAAAEHGEQNSHLTLAPNAIRDILKRISDRVGDPEAPVVAICGSGVRYFFRQMAEPAIRNLFFVSHNEIPAEVKVVSLGVIQ